MSVSVSTVRPGSIIEKKREFDKRVVSLTKDFEELVKPGRTGIEKEDIRRYLESNGIYNVRKLDLIFETLDKDMDGLITKFKFSINV
jgi:hypothetical protein